MILGIFLSLGDSFKNMAKAGQDELFKKFYLSYFAKNFSQVYVFSYARENVKGLPKNVQVIPNKYNLHRYLYSFLMPFLNLCVISRCDLIRAYHLFGTVPAIITKLFFNKNYVFNFAYDYQKIAQIEGQKIQEIALKLLKPIAMFFASKIFAANRKILAQIPGSKSVYLPNRVDTNFFKPRETRANKRPLVLSVGRLEKQKNFESLIEAMGGIKADLLIVGNGSLKSKLIKLARKNNVNLKIIEKVENTKMPNIYNQADIFVLPSLAEGSPKALLEAMACALSVIGSDVEGTAEMINDGRNGFLYDGAAANLSKKILSLLDDHQLMEEISKNARKTIVEKFDLGNLGRIEVKSLEKIIRS